MSIPVVTLGTSTWELVDRIERLHGSVTVVRRCLELADVLACAHTGMARAAVIAEGAEELTVSLLEQLAMGSVHVLVLEGHDHERLAELGVTVVPARASAQEVTGLVETVLAGPAPEAGLHGFSRFDAAPRARPEPAGSDAAATEEAPVEERGDSGRIVTTPEDEESASRRRGRVVTVWGPVGSPGKTVTALNLAAESALSGRSVLLVDADTYAASVAASLGMLEESAGLAQACRLADQGRMDREGLARCVTHVTVAGTELAVLTGITRHDRWPEIRSAALEAVVQRAVECYDLVVLDVASGLESDEEIIMDVVTPRRNAATLSACAMADVVVALGAADALGIPRLVKVLPELQDVAPAADVKVVVTKLRRTAVGRHAAEAVREAWERYSPGVAVHSTLDWNPDACDQALLAGAVLAETAATSSLRAQIRTLAERIGDPRSEETVPHPGATARPATRLGQRVGGWLRR